MDDDAATHYSVAGVKPWLIPFSCSVYSCLIAHFDKAKRIVSCTTAGREMILERSEEGTLNSG